MRKKILLSALLMTLTCFFTIPACAQENSGGVEVIREDVPHEIAVEDASYNSELANILSEISTYADDVVSWHVWGERDYQILGRENMARAIGHSEQVRNNSWVTATYHYTRTFFGANALTAVGDSGRVWGTYTVTAYGTWIYQSIADTTQLKVYYGTET